MTHRLPLVLLAASVLLSPFPGSGQNSATPPPAATAAPLTLSAVIAAAASRYPAIRAAEQEREAARNAIGVARAAYLPRADFLWQVNRSTTNKPNIVPFPQGTVPIPTPPARDTTGRSDWNTVTGVLFAWQPFDFGARHAQVEVASQAFESARHAADLTRLDIEAQAAGAFLDLVAARRMVAVEQANVNRMEAFARSIHVLVDNTLRPGADASQADAQLALARTQFIQAETQEKVHIEALANLLQLDPQQIQIDEAQIIAAIPEQAPTEAPLESHPAILEQTAFVAQQKEALVQLNRSWAPNFMLYGSVSGLGAGLSSASPPVFQGGAAGLAPQTYNWMAAFQVTFPAFQIFTLHRQESVQQARLGSAEATRLRMVGDVSAQVREARDLFEGARKVAENTPVELDAARQSEQQQRARYDAGLATVIEVSAAEAALAQAEGDDALARVNVWRGLAGVSEAEGDFASFLDLLNKAPKP